MSPAGWRRNLLAQGDKLCGDRPRRGGLGRTTSDLTVVLATPPLPLVFPSCPLRRRQIRTHHPPTPTHTHMRQPMGVEARLSTWKTHTHTHRLSPLREDDPLATFSLTDNYLRAPSAAPGGAAGHCCCGALPVGRGGSLLSRIDSIWTVNAQSADPSCIKGLPRWKRVERPPGDCSVKVSPRIRLNVIKHLGASPKTTPPCHPVDT